MDNETLTQILTIVVGAVIIPIVALLKKTVVGEYIRPEFLTALFAIGAAYLLSQWLAGPDVAIQQIVMLGLASAGITSVAYGGIKLKKGGK